MADDKPDPVVREREARASVDALMKGLADDARKAGQLPPMVEIEKVAREVTHDTIAKHEDQFRNGIPEKTPVVGAASSARLDRGEFALEDEVGPVEVIRRDYDPTRHAAKKAARRLPPEHELRHAICARQRFDFLSQWVVEPGEKPREKFPDWAERLRRAFTTVYEMAKTLGMTEAEKQNAGADAVLKVLDESDATFAQELGPWRSPKAEPRAFMYPTMPDFMQGSR